MKRILALAALVLIAGCSGLEGDRGKTGPAGPIAGPPEIESISPDSGSAGTIWTITGKNFDTRVDLTVLFDGFPAEILDVNKTTIRVTSAFPPVDAMTLKTVTIEAHNQVSNAMHVYAFPSGSLRELDFAKRIFGKPEAIVRDGNTLLVLDRERGVFRFDFATADLAPLFLNGRDGVERVWNLFPAPSGMHLLERKAGPFGTSFVLHRIVEGRLETRSSSAQELLAFAEDAAGRTYEAYGGSFYRFYADGMLDPSFFFSTSTPGAFAIIGDTFYATIPSAGVVVRSSITTPALVTHATVPSPRAMVTDGIELYVGGSTGLHRITVTGLVTTVPAASTWGMNPYDASLALAPDGKFLLGMGALPTIVKIDAAGVPSVALGGLASPRGIVRFRTGVVAYDECTPWSSPIVDGLPYGAFPFFGDDGRVNVKLSGPLPVEAMAPWKDGFAIPTWEGGKVFFLGGETGKLSTLVEPADVPETFRPGAVTELGGDLFVGYPTPAGPKIGRLAADGTWTPDFSVADPALGVYTIYGMTASGGKLWAHAYDERGGGLYVIDLDGTWVPASPGHLLLYIYAEVAYFHGDTLAPDGAGGVYFADGNTGDILRVAATGEIEWMTAFGSEIRVSGVEPDPKSGDLLVGNGRAFNEMVEPMTAVMP